MGIASKPLQSLPDTEQSFVELLDRHKRNLGIALGIILVAGAGAWFYTRSQAIKEARAETAFHAAMRSVFAGNARLAVSDLQKVAVRYDGTISGTEAVLQLAQLDYNEGKFKEGIDALKKAKPAEDLAFDHQMLIGAGYEGLNQGAEAAKVYEEAAQKASFDADKDVARANAARSYLSAGNKEAAAKIWTELANNPKSTLSAEARVRLGEATATTTKTS
jgi:tetratricopeptide (TPR) repeat protein